MKNYFMEETKKVKTDLKISQLELKKHKDQHVQHEEMIGEM